ncbi:MAG: iron-sulfur cluster assembly accessory protein [Bacteroidetes bacterium QS_8_68_28]|jgi:iron-sulfur cluster assembly protein|nr:MAG: iron-sulfur cluster assembly accessory protein [Bacteroidetes bacterium QS_8_68_28]
MELSQNDLFGDGPQTEATAKRELPALDLTITERALDQLWEVAREDDVDPGTAMLRVAVVPGGCSGLTYDLGWDTTEQESDTTEEAGGLCFVLDKKSRLYLSGTEMDFTDGLQGEGFHFKNPQAARTCACGESFGV